MSAEVSTQNMKWLNSVNELKRLETELANHINNCNASNNDTISVCCADLVFAVQNAKNVVNTEWNALYRLCSLTMKPT
jgi:hypothetical protein